MLNIVKFLLTIAIFPSFTLAQPYIEFHVQGQVDSDIQGRVVHVDYRMVFDTAAPPNGVGGSAVSFDPIFVEAIDSGQSGTDSPMRVNEPIQWDPDSPAPGLHYEPGLDRLVIHTLLDYLIITHPLGDFNAKMTSLPDDPNDYTADTTDEGASISLIAGFLDQIDWTPADGFFDLDTHNPNHGSFAVSIKLVDNPNAELCAPDLNNDGQLDFFDISTFLTLFSVGCP